MSKIVTCNVMGGLGNQLFQIFTCIATAIQQKMVFMLPYDKMSGNRNTYWDSFLNYLLPFTTHNPKNNKTNQDLLRFQTYDERVFHYNKIPELNQSTRLIGYYQSYKYFDEHKTAIFKFIRLIDHLKQTIQDYPSYFTRDTNTTTLVSMHFRLGDYKNLPNYHPLLPLEYYNKALTHVVTNVNQTHHINVLYCCEKEDNTLVQQKIKELMDHNPGFTDRVSFVKVEDSIPDWKQMLIMALCDHHIIANSTFSWFSAYLNNPEQNKIVCYPSIWFGEYLKTHNTCDLCLPSWTKI